MRYLYLHGFASSPDSRKAQAFRLVMQTVGVTLEIPALDDGDFEHLTISSQLSVLSKIIARQPVRLIGSSMGGYLAALFASEHPEVDKLVLLAPAFRLQHLWQKSAGLAKLDEWREKGTSDVFHYGSKSVRKLHYGFLPDLLSYPELPDFHQPALIFHGRSDTVVPIALSREFAAAHPAAVLRECESDHELGNVLDDITAVAEPFLTGREPGLH